MGEDLTFEEDFDPALSTAANSEIARIKKDIKTLKQELKSKSTTVPISRLEELKKGLGQLTKLGVTPSQMADLESLLPQPSAFSQTEEKAPAAIEESANLGATQPDVSKEDIEELYVRASALYNGGKYKEAFFAFSNLNSFAPNDPRFVMGLGGCQLGENRYNEAAITFAFASAIDIKNPIPTLYLAECQLKLGQIELALQSLEEVILRSLNKPEYAGLGDRARLTLQKLKNHPKG